jgi:hypothetical protein
MVGREHHVEHVKERVRDLSSGAARRDCAPSPPPGKQLPAYLGVFLARTPCHKALVQTR